MGYDVHITRREDWSDEHGPSISTQEWLGVVNGDPQLRLDVDNGPYFAVWDGTSKDETGFLDWSDGNIVTKNPTGEMVRKMMELARNLDARVQGDDGEIYDESALGVPAGYSARAAWMQFMKGMAIQMLVFALLGGMILYVFLWLNP